MNLQIPIITDDTGKAIAAAISQTDVAQQRIAEINEAAQKIYQDLDEHCPNYAQVLTALQQKTEKVQIDYDGNVFKRGDETLNFEQLHDIHLVGHDFAFIVYNNRAYLLSYVQDGPGSMQELRFQSVIATTESNLSYVKTSGIYVKSNDGINILEVDLTDINSENKAYKATVIDDYHKNDVWYPSTKAVVDYVSEKFNDESGLTANVESLYQTVFGRLPDKPEEEPEGPEIVNIPIGKASDPFAGNTYGSLITNTVTSGMLKVSSNQANGVITDKYVMYRGDTLKATVRASFSTPIAEFRDGNYYKLDSVDSVGAPARYEEFVYTADRELFVAVCSIIQNDPKYEAYITRAIQQPEQDTAGLVGDVESLNKMREAAEEAVGRYAKVKSVHDGVVTGFEFVEMEKDDPDDNALTSLQEMMNGKEIVSTVPLTSETMVPGRIYNSGIANDEGYYHTDAIHLLSGEKIVAYTKSNNRYILWQRATSGNVKYVNLHGNTSQGALTVEYLAEVDVDVFVGCYQPDSGDFNAKIYSHQKGLLEKVEFLEAENNTSVKSVPPRIILPDRIDAVVEDELQLFYKAFVEHPMPEFYNIECICNCGKPLHRYFSLTPTSAQLGEHELTVNVRTSDDTIVASRTTVINVLAPGTAPQNPVNVLCIGDSLTAGGQWVNELHRRLSTTDGDMVNDKKPIGNGFGNINFIGTIRPNESTWYPGDSEDWYEDRDSIGYEGRGGWYWKRYAGETVSPFWNLDINDIDFATYCSENGYSGIDYVYALMTWNQGGAYKPTPEDNTEEVNAMMHFIDRLHEQYPAAKVTICTPPKASLKGGSGWVYGANDKYSNWYGLVRSNNGLIEAYQAVADDPKYSGFVEFVDTSCQVDSENVFPTRTLPLNYREKTLTYNQDREGVHPNNTGYMMIADAIYRNAIRRITH